MSDDVSILNHNVIEADPKIQVDRRPPVKMSTTPEIVIAIPCGDKHTATTLVCSDEKGQGCGAIWMKPGMRQPNLIPVQLMLAHMNLVAPLNCSMSYMVEAGRLSAEARQIMTKKAIADGAKYILYWDDDTIPPPLALYTLYNWMRRNPEAGAVSGIYTTRETPNEPLVYEAHGVGPYWNLPIGPGAEPQKIFGAGAGFLLARVDAIVDTIEKLKEDNDGVEIPIWADERTVSVSKGDNGVQKSKPSMWGHDVRFCRVLNEAGWPVYAHGEVLCSHLDIMTGKMFDMPDDAPGWTVPRDGASAYPTTVAALPDGDPRVIEFIKNQIEAYPSDSLVFAEIGVYEGATTEKIAELLDGKDAIHLFDFEDKVDLAFAKAVLAGGPMVYKHPNTRSLYDSYNWSLQKAMDGDLKIDVAFLDGAHSFHHDALAFFLLDRMVRPGGYILFDDYDWSHATSPSMNPGVFPQIKNQYTDEQINTKQIKLLVDSLVKTHPNYEEVIPGFAYKKLS